MRTQLITLAAALLVLLAACFDVAERATGPTHIVPPDLAEYSPRLTPSDVLHAGALTGISGRHHTTRDVQRMGLPAVQVIVTRDLLARNEAELALLQAQSPMPGSSTAERIEELNSQIVTSREILEVMGEFMASGAPLADGGDEDFCRKTPSFGGSPGTTQDLERGDEQLVTIRATGHHRTDEDAMYTVATVINVWNKRTTVVVENTLDVERDPTCLSKFSPFTDPSLRVRKDRDDFEDLCAESWSNHRAVSLSGDPPARATSPVFPYCDDLGEGAPEHIRNPVRH